MAITISVHLMDLPVLLSGFIIAVRRRLVVLACGNIHSVSLIILGIIIPAIALALKPARVGASEAFTFFVA